MTAVGLLKGNLVAEDYEDDVASDPRIDLLRSKMVIEEDKRYSREYLEADKRSVANAVQIFFEDGSSTEKIEVEYPIGHRRRREEGLPLLIEKFKNNLGTQFSESRSEVILNLCLDESKLESTAVSDFMELIVLE
jgi:2-methylcitrate dehydratase